MTRISDSICLVSTKILISSRVKIFLGEWFREAAERSALARGLKPDATQCIGFSVPLIFAESGSPDAPHLVDLYEHISFLGDLNRQISSLPDGAKVRLRVKS